MHGPRTPHTVWQIDYSSQFSIKGFSLFRPFDLKSILWKSKYQTYLRRKELFNLNHEATILLQRRGGSALRQLGRLGSSAGWSADS